MFPSVQEGCLFPSVQEGCLFPSVQEGCLFPCVLERCSSPNVQKGFLSTVSRRDVHLPVSMGRGKRAWGGGGVGVVHQCPRRVFVSSLSVIVQEGC